MILENTGLTFITVLAGFIGGLLKTISIVPLHINLSHCIEVVFFAVISASTGYLVKFSLDRLMSCIRKLRQLLNKRKP